MLLAPLAPQRRQATRQIGLLLVPTAGVVLMLLFHSAVRWHLRGWYFAPAGLIGAALLGVAVSYVASLLHGTRLGWRVEAQEQAPSGSGLPPPGRWRRWAAAALYPMVVLALVGVYGPQQSDDWLRRMPHRLNMLEGARWLEGNTAPEARIGSFNAGIFGYFSGRTVINLDGVVNEDAYKARRDGRTMDYICAQEIRYLVDLEQEYWVSSRCRDDPSLQFELVAKIGRPLSYFRGGQVTVLELVSMPEPPATEDSGFD
jgi:hypothetical protein